LIEIVRITRKNLADIIPLMAAMQEELGCLSDPELLEDHVEAMMKKRDGRLVVLCARKGRFPVAYISGSFCMDPLSRGSAFMITEIFVSKPFRGGRVLKKLINGLKTFVKARDIKTLFALTRHTERDFICLAESLGFDHTGREMIELIL